MFNQKCSDILIFFVKWIRLKMKIREAGRMCNNALLLAESRSECVALLMYVFLVFCFFFSYTQHIRHYIAKKKKIMAMICVQTYKFGDVYMY